METRNILDVRTIVAVVSFGALVLVVLWSIGFGLTSTQSLQNQVTDLVAQRNSLQSQVTSLQNQVASLNAQLAENQNQVASLNTQLAEKQIEIEYLEALVIVYRMDFLNYYRQAYPDAAGAGPNNVLI